MIRLRYLRVNCKNVMPQARGPDHVVGDVLRGAADLAGGLDPIWSLGSDSQKEEYITSRLAA